MATATAPIGSAIQNPRYDSPSTTPEVAKTVPRAHFDNRWTTGTWNRITSTVLPTNIAAGQTALACIRVTSRAGNTTSSTLKHMAKGKLATNSTVMPGARPGPSSCLGSTAVTLVDKASP